MPTGQKNCLFLPECNYNDIGLVEQKYTELTLLGEKMELKNVAASGIEWAYEKWILETYYPSIICRFESWGTHIPD